MGGGSTSNPVTSTMKQHFAKRLGGSTTIEGGIQLGGRKAYCSSYSLI